MSAGEAKRGCGSGQRLNVAVHTTEPGAHRVDGRVRSPRRMPAPYDPRNEGSIWRGRWFWCLVG